VAGAAQWLREQPGCARVVAVGVGLGGLLAYETAATGAPIDDLILWAVPARGRSYMRELRVYADIVSGSLGDIGDAHRTDGVLGIGGHPMSAETAAAIDDIRLDELELPNARERRVMLIGRDDHGVDRRLQDHLTEQGVKLTLQTASDYSALMEVAEFDLAPTETISRSIQWLAEIPTKEIARDSQPHAPDTASSIIFEITGRLIRETLTSLQTPQGRMVGIITEPIDGESSDISLVAVNSGALRRTGPNRLTPVMARRAAAAGISAARFDLPGLGDSDGEYVQRAERTYAEEEPGVQLISKILDHLESEGIANRFVACGLCSGAYWPMRAAIRERRLVACILINLRVFKWTPREAARANIPWPPDPNEKKSIRARAREFAVAVALKRGGQLPWRLRFHRDLADARRVFSALNAHQTRALFIFSQTEQMLEMLEGSGTLMRISKRWPAIRVQTLPTIDHEVRPFWVQEILLDLVDAELRSLAK
jgi:dienelactone hydrolase